MIKEYFTDGLLQIAIVLSLLRTDLDSFVGLSYNNHRLLPELHETFLDSLSGYTQTDTRVHNLWNADGIGGIIHPKSIYNSYPESIFRELHSLSSFRRFDGIERNLNAFLVNGPETLSPRGQRSSPDPASSPGAGQTAESEGSVPNSDGHELEGAAGSGDFLQNSEDDLTKEEMELIEVLWRQDIDLGIGREMFETSLRQDAEEKEFNLEKHNQTKEITKDEKNESGNQNSFPVLDLSANYIIDGETGEIVSQPPAQVPASSQPSGEINFFDLFPDIMGLEQADAVPSYGNDLPLLEQPHGSSVEFYPQQMYEEPQPQESEQVPDGLAVFSDLLGRQNSLEQCWQDVVGLLNLPDFAADNFSSSELNQSVVASDPVQPVVQNVSLADLTYSEPLMMSQDFQVAALPSYPVFNESEMNMSYQPTGMDMMSTANPSSSSGIAFEDVDPAFLSLDNVSALQLTSLDYSGLRENNISNFSSADLESLFQHIFNDTGFDGNRDNSGQDFEFERPSGVEITRPPASEDISDDSAISSISSPPLQLYQNLADQSDGADEASGGKDVLSTCDLDFEKYQYNTEPEFRSESFLHETNSSTSSNDTSFRSSKSIAKHLYHNHTYVLQPGQVNREEKEEALRRDKELKAARSRDEKRAKEMKLPFTVDQIISTPVEDFTQMMSRFSLSEAQQQLIRDIRRRGKNKQAAQNCRKRKMNVIQTLEEEVACLQREQNTLLQNRRQIDRETSQIKDKLVRLQTELFRSLRDDNGQPYNPNEYSLQQLPDGNLFLVPKNNTVEKGRVEKPVRKRKPKRKE